MLGTILSIFAHPYVWAAALVVAAILAALYFLNPAMFLKVITNAKLWFGLALVALFLAYANDQKDIKDLNQQVSTLQQQHTSDKDATTVTQKRVVQKTQRATQTATIQDKIDHAQPGQAEDAALDAIASQRDGAGSDTPSVGLPKQPDGHVEP